MFHFLQPGAIEFVLTPLSLMPRVQSTGKFCMLYLHTYGGTSCLLPSACSHPRHTSHHLSPPLSQRPPHCPPLLPSWPPSGSVLPTEVLLFLLKKWKLVHLAQTLQIIAILLETEPKVFIMASMTWAPHPAPTSCLDSSLPALPQQKVNAIAASPGLPQRSLADTALCSSGPPSSARSLPWPQGQVPEPSLPRRQQLDPWPAS